MAKKKELHLTEVRDAHAKITQERSSKWPTVEKKHLKLQPTCAACGGNMHLNVHHKKPFHLFPELELEPTNLITLCMDGDKDCHIKLGHGGSFKAYNPNVEEDVKAVAQNFNMELLTEIAVKAKKAKLLA
jgi:hypothetical protein